MRQNARVGDAHAGAGSPRVRLRRTLEPAEEREVRRLMDAAFEGDFAPADWRHALGGTHALAYDGAVLVGHASVVPRDLWVEEERLACGYVEAVAVSPDLQRRGIGTALMRALEPALDRYELGVLSTDAYRFYERLGWERWRGTTWVRTESGPVRTADEDDGIMVRRTRLTPGDAPVAPTDSLCARLTCLPREGDDW